MICICSFLHHQNWLVGNCLFFLWLFPVLCSLMHFVSLSQPCDWIHSFYGEGRLLDTQSVAPHIPSLALLFRSEAEHWIIFYCSALSRVLNPAGGFVTPLCRVISEQSSVHCGNTNATSDECMAEQKTRLKRIWIIRKKRQLNRTYIQARHVRSYSYVKW